MASSGELPKEVDSDKSPGVKERNPSTKSKRSVTLQLPGAEEGMSTSPRSRPRLSFDESSIANTNRGGSQNQQETSQSANLNPTEDAPVTTISTGKLAPESILRRASTPNNSNNSAPRPSLHSNTSDDQCSEIARLDHDPPPTDEESNLPRIRRVVRILQVSKHKPNIASKVLCP